MNLDDRQPAFTQAQGHGRGVQAHAVEHHRVAVGDQVLPVVLGRRHAGVDGLVQGKVDAVAIAANQPGPLVVELAVVDVVLVVFNPRRQAREGLLRLRGIQGPDFTGGLAAQRQQQLALGARSIAVQEKPPVRFMEDFFGGRAVEAIAKQFVRAMGLVQFGEEQRQAVVGPGHAAVAVLERQLADLAVGQLLDEQGVGLVADGVQAVRQALVVRADAEGAQREEAAIGQLVGVEQQLLPAFIDLQAIVGRARAAVVPGILVAGDGTGVVQVRPPWGRQRQIGFENPALYFIEQGFAQPGLIGQLGFLVVVFGLEVVQHGGGVPFLQPGVRIITVGLAGNRGAANVGGSGHVGLSDGVQKGLHGQRGSLIREKPLS
ncbi:hypothetical protein D3C84_622880 [compost metagenome]